MATRPASRASRGRWSASLRRRQPLHDVFCGLEGFIELPLKVDVPQIWLVVARVSPLPKAVQLLGNLCAPPAPQMRLQATVVLGLVLWPGTGDELKVSR